MKESETKQGRVRGHRFFSSFPIHPEMRAGGKRELVEKRNLISSFFIAMLIGLAYKEMIVVVRESVRTSGITVGTLILAGIFFLTSMRFFIGNQLHLLSETLVKMRGDIWFYDFMVITFQTVLLAFLGGTSSVEVCRATRIGFVKLLVALYVIDILWILSQWGLGKISPSWRREFIPWAWAVLNAVLVVCIALVYLLTYDLYCNAALIGLGILGGLAFVADVFLVDYFNII